MSESSKRSMSNSEVREAFGLFDTNNDGIVTDQEVRDLIKALGGDPKALSARPLLREAEARGGLCLDSFVSLWKAFKASSFSDNDNEEDIMDAFKSYDKNNDGFITIDEMTEVLMSMGFVGDKEQEAVKCLREMDVDGDNKVSYTEFLLKWRMS